MRVSGGGASASNIGLKRNPAIHCTRLVSFHISQVAGIGNEHREYDAEGGRDEQQDPEPASTEHLLECELCLHLFRIVYAQLTKKLRRAGSLSKEEQED